MDKLLTSVVIPTYLRPDALEACVRSLFEGAAQPDEIVVIGRESDQATRQLLESWGSGSLGAAGLRCAWVKVAGHIPPVDAGLHLATGELVAFLDDDVTVTHGWLPAILRHFSDPSVGVVGGRVVVPGVAPYKLRGKPGRVTWFGKTWGNVAAMDGERVVEVDTVMECNWVWRRALLGSLDMDPVLNFDDAAMYGLDLCLQAKALGYRVLYDPQALVYHHVKPRAPELDRAERPPRAFAYCRNYTYIMLKNLPRWRIPVFLAWWFGVGERAAVGLGAWLANALSDRKHQRGETRRSLAGKIEGIRLWLRRAGQRSLSGGLVS
ncbi:MAG TPA: glycosyltransferase [Candidatus Dormibacteraeota bacterium]|nr:glycosyltransferase [Candidatus Dormibacteraeota bacterium]